MPSKCDRHKRPTGWLGSRLARIADLGVVVVILTSLIAGCAMSPEEKTATIIGASGGAVVGGEAVLGSWLDSPTGRRTVLEAGVPIGAVVGAAAGAVLGYYLARTEMSSDCAQARTRIRMIEGAFAGAIMAGQLPFLKWAADPDGENAFTLQAGVPAFALTGAFTGAMTGRWMAGRYADPPAASASQGGCT